MINAPHVPERFKKVVVLHIIKNLLAENPADAPLLLGIHGPSGDGKTYQCHQVLSEMGVRQFLIAGSELEDFQAGQPAAFIRARYVDAGNHIKKARELRDPLLGAAVIINDFDAGVGNWGERVQYTVNRQNVIVQLMHLADYPTLLEDISVPRVPIILTGNDFTKLYSPLVRAGRMTSFEWQPTKEEKVGIVNTIFPHLSRKASETLIQCLEEVAAKTDSGNSYLSIAFYSHLRTILLDDHLWGLAQNIGINRIVSYLTKGEQLQIRQAPPLEKLIEEGETLIASGRLVNHLGAIS